MSEVHRHSAAICVWCRQPVAFNPPVANAATQGATCAACGENSVVGIRGGVVCTDCRADWAASVERLNGWGTASRA